MNNVRRLRNTKFSIDFDFPRGIQEARGRLWPRYKQLKVQNPRSKVRIVYPAKLMHDGNLIQDELPEWGKYIGANWLLKIGEVGRMKVPHTRGTDSPQ
ncbi:hypothetical protein DPMN_136197 [Dreissena polymorpha]|uniref:Uncharacterized protein n=1 Tax=Dreissena polymorpha TaxID=45954 RepID=A0A9D4FZD2_DREPO|nr:hypothetical protein DPMN_136197 [Dreissena polymorpha]